MSAVSPVAVVTGANRGIGRQVALELARAGHAVVVTARSPAAATDTAAELAAQSGGTVVGAVLDVTDGAQAAELAALVAERFGRLDALVHNAGAIFDDGDDVDTVDPALLLRSIDNNAMGALRLTQALLPLLRAAPDGANVVHVSSGMGGLTEMGGGYPGYRLSKTVLNGLTRLLHAAHAGEGLRVNSVCPGWVRTDMGGANANRSVEEGAAGVVWAATLGPDGPAGGFFRDGRPIAW
ncbi:MAG: SDR family NAD(P)-dependent oxidoreductase [Alphaproteobacteria bacterium]|nr:SDR family NAD(P)-dependent oxidoreductase [Alphaproteobacteria bacterium]